MKILKIARATGQANEVEEEGIKFLALFFYQGPIARLVEEVRYDEAGFPREIRTRDYLFVVSFHYLINFFTIIHCLHACHLYYYLYTNVKYFCWRVCIDVVHSTLVGVDELG